MTTFMETLIIDLMDNRKITQTTAELYIRNLRILNGSEFKSLSFLRDMDTIKSKLDGLSPGTRRNYLIAIVSALSLIDDRPLYKKLHDRYVELMNSSNEAYTASKPAVGTKSESQKENWVSFEDVMEKMNGLRELITEFAGKKAISPAQFNTLLSAMVLSLYVLQPPRRNKDYNDMYIVPNMDTERKPDRNYLDIDKQRFIFRVYKTAKSYGEQVISYADNEPLKAVIDIYVKHHPSIHRPTGKKTVDYEVPFLVGGSGYALQSNNSITRILNRIFKKRVGSSLLRHIYLSNKFGDAVDDMKETAKAMAHSVSTAQNEYVKTD